jgi:tRNA nucleotidyltransferase (CCA-adding enzyme)
MYLPENALLCIRLLEEAGYPCYAVGGCVRDSRLGLQPHDYDLCTAAHPDQIKRIFADFGQIHAGEKHGTIGIIFPNHEIYEITTFRTEGGYRDGRHPDWVEFVPEIREDLARRDFTVNAMAYSPTNGYCDPFGGQADLASKRLRAVGDPRQRFSEDALRILRGVRFCVTYDLTPEAETAAAMAELAPLMDKLARERVFEELCKLLPRLQPHHMTTFAPILTQVIPELQPAIGFDQRNPHHIYDIYTHTAHVVAAVPPSLPLRWAALLHDIGKPETFSLDEAGCGHFYGHADTSARIADTILRRLKAPNDLREQVVQLIQLHMTTILPERQVVRRWLSRLGRQQLEDLLTLQQADKGGKATGCAEDTHQSVHALMAEILAENACLRLRDLAVNGHDLMALGYTGPTIGQALHALLEAVLSEDVPNEKAALLAHLQQQIRL